MSYILRKCFALDCFFGSIIFVFSKTPLGLFSKTPLGLFSKTPLGLLGKINMDHRTYERELLHLFSTVDDSKKHDFITRYTSRCFTPGFVFGCSLLFGPLGIDRLALRQPVLWLLKLVTVGGLGIWAIIDWFFVGGTARLKNIDIARAVIREQITLQGVAASKQFMNKQAAYEQAWKKHAMNVQAMNEQAAYEQAWKKHAMNVQAMNEQAVDHHAAEQQAKDHHAEDQQATNEQAVERLAEDQQAMNELAVVREGQ